MTMLSLSRRLGITPRPDQEDDPAAAGWLDSVRPESGQPALVPQQWAGTRAVRDRERANYPTDGHPTGEHSATPRGPHPLGSVDAAAAALTAPGPTLAALLAETQSIEQPTAAAQRDGAWPEICDQYGSRMLVLAEQLRASLNVLEAGEDDPERLQRLYQVDHAVTRMRLATRQLRTLAGRNEGRIAGFTTSLLDVIRMASSAIEWYSQVSVGRVTDLAVLGYAADDVAALMSALLDNATRYSPDMVTVSCHLLEEGGVMFRVEDTGTGFGQDQLARLNAALAGPVPDVKESTGRHTGFPVVHRIARKHAIVVRLASRSLPGHGTIAMVMLPPQLLCAIPVEDQPRRSTAESAAAGSAATGPAAWPTETAWAAWSAEPQAAAPSAVPDPPHPEWTTLAESSAQEMPSPEMGSADIVPTDMVPTDMVQTDMVQTEMVSPERVSTELAPAEPDQDRLPVPLPRREPATLRVEGPMPAEAAAPMPAEQAAARRVFADDLNAFSQGIQDALAARGITNASSAVVSGRSDGAATGEPEGAAIEEGARS